MLEFNEAMFKTKVDNIFVKLYTSIMKQDLSDVDHFIADDFQKELEEKINILKKQNKRQMYDELNVKESNIESIDLVNGQFVVNVFLQARYMDYILDLSTGNVISGNDNSRIQVNYMLTFTKKCDATSQGIAKKCHACGAPMDVNNSGKCDYCGSIYKQEEHDWVLENLIKR